MTLRYGTDTSVLMRLLTGHPEDEYERCRRELTQMVQQNQAEIFASHQVIGEAYIAVQHHYGISKADARQALAQVLSSGRRPPQRPGGPGHRVRTRRSRAPGPAHSRGLIPSGFGNPDAGPENGRLARSPEAVAQHHRSIPGLA